MADRDTLSDIQKKGSELKNAPDAFRQSAAGGADKVLSPFTKKKQEADAAIQAVNAPFEAMRAKQQQATQAMNAAKQEVGSAKKILDVKELLFGTANDISNKTMNDAQSTLTKAKQGIGERQKDYNNAGAFVKDLMAKIEAQAKSAAGDAGRAPGVK
jgi:hypothetical protein